MGANLNLRDNNGKTALYHAIEPCNPKNKADVENRTKIVKMLLEAGADPNIPDNNGITPLMLAEEKGLEEIANLLKKHGAI